MKLERRKVMKKLTQADRVLRHLKDNGSITSWEAIQQYGITRLSAKIYDLKHEGYVINSEYETAKNRYGENVSFKRYILMEE